MVTPSKIRQDNRQFAPGKQVMLYTLDATAIGGPVLRFCDSKIENAPLIFQGNTYTPFDIMAEGFEISSSGTLPEPTLRISNATLAIAGTVIALGDLLGAKFIRMRTYDKYLDNGSNPDPDRHFPIDEFVVSQKSSHNRLFIEWKLATAIDVEGQKLPRRLVIRNLCTQVYRVFNPDTGNFDYTKATCPYAAEDKYFDINGNITLRQLDVCGKRLSDCALRFSPAPLPTRSFPGAGKFS